MRSAGTVDVRGSVSATRARYPAVRELRAAGPLARSSSVLTRPDFVGVQVQHRSSGCARRVARHAAACPAATAAPSLPVRPAEQAAPVDSKLDWMDQWFPIAFTRDIPDKAPYAFRLLDQPIVIWRDGEGRYRCLRDACPHRLVPLSDGRITPDGNEIQCAYHGWQFEGCGACTLMPQGGDPTAARACATAYCCAERQGLVWVKLKPAPADGTEPDTSGIHTLPELDDPDWLGFGDMWRDIPYDWATLIENVVDAGHVPFTHHGSVSKRQSSGNFDDMRITERGEYGFKGIWPTGPRKGGLGAQLTLFQGPVLMRHTIDAYDTKGFANITSVYGVPVAPGRCRAIVRQPIRFKNKLLPLLFKLSPQFLGHLGNNSVLDEDVIFLHMQEEEAARRGMGVKPAGQVFYMPAASDAYVMGFRSWLSSVAGGGPWGPMDQSYLARAGPRRSEAQLLDHFHSHTEKCSICQKALRNVRIARTAAAVVAVGAAFLGAAALLAAWTAAGAPLPAWQALTADAAAWTAAGAPLPAWQALTADAAAGAAATAAPRLTVLARGCAVVAVLAGLVWRWCQQTVPRFYRGERPFARNRVPGEFTP
ncbi:Pheophorbide a oxygenase [Micractinium conductrix]|uniref:Pheophorbide a oxygenase n=1 Tax=Micractinium conductrix TaxID=554055 RepID=A0A2P6VM18_9CHLO|nr:Pheophorbide a oxygenase [Micractinium conductrix]|eukprot:PSC75151.1 Pheophorbide a oxygenase [Micractinium conductrix]